jgi:hypothetical protein
VSDLFMTNKRVNFERIPYRNWKPKYLQKLRGDKLAQISLSKLVHLGCDPLMLTTLVYNCSAGPNPDRINELKRRKELLRIIKKAQGELQQIEKTLQVFERLLRNQTEGYRSAKAQFATMLRVMDTYLTLTVRDASARGELRVIVDAVDLFEYVRLISGEPHERDLLNILEPSFSACGASLDIDNLGRAYERYVKEFPQLRTGDRKALIQVARAFPHAELKPEDRTFKTQLEKIVASIRTRKQLRKPL